MTEMLQITSAHEWAAWAEGTLEKLPSGKVVRLMPVDVIDMILSDGTVYDMFATMQKTGDAVTEDNFEEMIQQYPKLKPFLGTLAMAAIGEPIVVRENADPAKGEILLDHVFGADRLFIFQKVFGEAQSLAALFPAEQDRDVHAAPSSDELRAKAKQLGGADA